MFHSNSLQRSHPRRTRKGSRKIKAVSSVVAMADAQREMSSQLQINNRLVGDELVVNKYITDLREIILSDFHDESIEK